MSESAEAPAASTGAIISEMQIVLLVLLSFIIFYLGYDQAKKSFRFGPMLGGIFGFKNIEFSFMQLNKALAMSGFTVFGYSYLNFMRNDAWWLGQLGYTLLFVHGMYSMATYVDHWSGPKKIAISLGVATWVFIYLMFPACPYDILALGLGTLHVYLMKRKDGKLQLRGPYGYLPFLVALGAFGLFIARGFKKEELSEEYKRLYNQALKSH